MSVRRKLFLVMLAFVVGTPVVFAAVSEHIHRGILQLMVEGARTKELQELSDRFVGYYERNGASWDDVRTMDAGLNGPRYEGRRATVVLRSPDGTALLEAGDGSLRFAERFGIRRPLEHEGEAIGYFIYHDDDVEFLSKLRIGLIDATRVFLVIATVVFIGLSLIVVWWLAKRLTAPLRTLTAAIDRLGQGQFGVRADVSSNDEYGKVAAAFNDMSERLRRAEETRKNLAADVAHELRTPITIVRGQLDMLQQQGQAVDPLQLLPLQDELIRLTRLVEDLRQLSLAEARRLPLERKPADMALLLQQLVERMRPDAESRGIALRFVRLTDHATASVDANRMAQVFLNLLSNAFRYTPEGGTVTVVVEREEKSRGRLGRLRISVADTGIGIDEAHLPRLFDRFYRTDEARDRVSGGTGLGLAIVKEFVEAHGGEIEVTSEVGKGAIFVVLLPN